MNTKLITILKKETESLKVQFLELTKNWAINAYETSCFRVKWAESDWCEYLGITPRLVNNGANKDYLSFPKGFHNTSKSREYMNEREKCRMIVGSGLDKYIAKELKTAESHYEDSILKLSLRIESKGLDINKIKATTSHIGVNIDTTLTDGEKSVRAFTIVASGAVQRPHYRYLIK